MQEAHFYGGGVFLRRRFISTNEANFIQWALPITCMKRRNYCTSETICDVETALF